VPHIELADYIESRSNYPDSVSQIDDGTSQAREGLRQLILDAWSWAVDAWPPSFRYFVWAAVGLVIAAVAWRRGDA